MVDRDAEASLTHYCGCSPTKPCMTGARLFRRARRSELRCHLRRTQLFSDAELVSALGFAKERTMRNANGILSGAHARLFELAIKSGISPTLRAIAIRSGLSENALQQAFGKPGKSVNSTTIERVANALGVHSQEIRKIHAKLQLEAPELKPDPRKVPETIPAPPPVPEPEPEPDPTPRNFWQELTQYALDNEIVIVAGTDRGEACLARGRISGLHGGWVAIQAEGDKRPIRIRIEAVNDVRKVSA